MLPDLELIGKAEVAKTLGYTLRGLNKLIARGELPRPFKIGRRAFWRRVTFARHLERLERGGK